MAFNKFCDTETFLKNFENIFAEAIYQKFRSEVGDPFEQLYLYDEFAELLPALVSICKNIGRNDPKRTSRFETCLDNLPEDGEKTKLALEIMGLDPTVSHLHDLSDYVSDEVPKFTQEEKLFLEQGQQIKQYQNRIPNKDRDILVLIDGYVLVYKILYFVLRRFKSIKFMKKVGNKLYILESLLQYLISTSLKAVSDILVINPKYISFVFDFDKDTFRHRIFKGYKGHRKMKQTQEKILMNQM